MSYNLEIDDEVADKITRDVLFANIERLMEEIGKTKRGHRAVDREAELQLIALKNTYDYFGGYDK